MIPLRLNRDQPGVTGCLSQAEESLECGHHIRCTGPLHELGLSRNPYRVVDLALRARQLTAQDLLGPRRLYWAPPRASGVAE